MSNQQRKDKTLEELIKEGIKSLNWWVFSSKSEVEEVSEFDIEVKTRHSIDWLLSEIDQAKEDGADSVSFSYDKDDCAVRFLFTKKVVETEDERKAILIKALEDNDKKQIEILATEKAQRRIQFQKLKQEFEPEDLIDITK